VSASTPSGLKIELIVWHHRRRTRRLPYSAAAYLLDPSKPEHHQVIEAGSCLEAGTEGEAARDALRELQERLGASDVLKAKERYDEVLVRALADPEALPQHLQPLPLVFLLLACVFLLLDLAEGG
jgi:hypothetical protein